MISSDIVREYRALFFQLRLLSYRNSVIGHISFNSRRFPYYDVLESTDKTILRIRDVEHQ